MARGIDDLTDHIGLLAPNQQHLYDNCGEDVNNVYNNWLMLFTFVAHPARAKCEADRQRQSGGTSWELRPASGPR